MESVMDNDTLLRIGFFVLAFIIVLITRNRQNASADVLFETLALKHNGIFMKGNILSGPRLKIDDEGSEIVVFATSGGKNTPPHTWFQAGLSSTMNYKIHLYREYKFYQIGKMLGLQDVKVENPEFDDAFIVQGSEELLVRNFLSSEVQAALLPWKERNAILRIQNKQLQFFVPQRFQQEQEYDQLIETGRLLLRQAKGLG